MSEIVDEVLCPALGRKIDIGYCMELEMAADNMIIWDGMEDKFNEQQIDLCKKCKKRIDPAAE